MKKELKGLWKKCGTLADIDDSLVKSDKGVYIFVFEGNPNRIIYVGTAFRTFKIRWEEHKQHLRVGGFSIFRPLQKKTGDFHNIDIYDSMKYDRSNPIGDMEKHFRNLMWKKLVWLPGNKRRIKTQEYDKLDVFDGHYFYKYDFFVEEWIDYVEKYMNNIVLFACSISDENEAKDLETQIQYIFREKHNLGFYKNADQCWLGKEGNKPTAFDREIKFEGLDNLLLHKDDTVLLSEMKKEFLKRH